MADQILPHYAKDFVRKNRARIDESLVTKKEVKPTFRSDWAIALLVFPGSVLFLFVVVFFSADWIQALKSTLTINSS